MKRKAGPWKYHARKRACRELWDGLVLAYLHSQSGDLARSHRFRRGLARPGAGYLEAYHLRGAMPLQYVADRPDLAEEQPFLSANDSVMNK